MDTQQFDYEAGSYAASFSLYLNLSSASLSHHHGHSAH